MMKKLIFLTIKYDYLIVKTNNQSINQSTNQPNTNGKQKQPTQHNSYIKSTESNIKIHYDELSRLAHT